VQLVLVLVLVGCGGQEARALRPGGSAVLDGSTVGVSNADQAEPAARQATVEPSVVVIPLTDGVWLHTSYHGLPGVGRFPSNDLVFDADRATLADGAIETSIRALDTRSTTSLCM